MSTTDLFIVGASTRAAAASALRAGFRPWCLDLFGDADLVRACPCRTVPLAGYAEAMMKLLDDGPPGPWMYTGGFENHPSVFALAKRRLWGNLGPVVERVREPSVFRDRMQAAGVPCLPRLSGDDAARWILKPRRGSGGLDVRRWEPGEPFDDKKYFLQEYISGDPVSAVYLADGRETRLLGVSFQMIGTPWLHAARPFQYAGSIGPFDIRGAFREGIERLGRDIAQAFPLRGLFGVDGITDGRNNWPIEVNPRYTASIEILERSTGRPYLADHAAVFDCSRTSPAASDQGSPGLHAKAILFAKHDIVFPKDGPWMAAFDHKLSDLDVPFADIPAPGQQICRGDPVLTLFARGHNGLDCERALRKIVRGLDRVLFRR